MTENIFNQSADQAPETVQPVVQEPVVPPELAEFVGAGKKYASVAEVYKAFPHAQKHISTLEDENKQLKEELTRRQAAEEVLNAIQQRMETPSQTQEQPPVNSLQDIQALVRQELERDKAASISMANQHEVVNKFTQLYGDKAQSQFENLARDLNVPITYLNNLAATSPKALYKLAGIEGSKNTHSGKLESDLTLTQNIQEQNDKLTVSLNGGAKEDAAAIRKAREQILKQYT